MKTNDAKGAPRRPRVKKDDWLNAALKLLCESGIESVRVEVLAARLSVAKSGFYYHFTNREGLYDALLDHWNILDQEPNRTIDELSNLDPRDGLVAVIKMVDELDLGNMDFAIRQWAHRDKKVRKAYNKEVMVRLELNRTLFAMLGFKGDDLEMRTRVFVAYVTTERQVFPNLTNKERWKLRNLMIDTLLRRD
ncbi:MAG: TetR/AcrR family transcriptional regulator [Methyloligellaceae bacterium]